MWSIWPGRPTFNWYVSFKQPQRSLPVVKLHPKIFWFVFCLLVSWRMAAMVVYTTLSRVMREVRYPKLSVALQCQKGFWPPPEMHSACSVRGLWHGTWYQNLCSDSFVKPSLALSQKCQGVELSMLEIKKWDQGSKGNALCKGQVARPRTAPQSKSIFNFKNCSRYFLSNIWSQRCGITSTSHFAFLSQSEWIQL